MKRFLFLLIFLSCDASVWAQSAKEQLPSGESVYVHINSSVFVTGETLLFKTYCLQLGKLSVFSKIAYVELIGQDAKPIMQTKIELDNGEGSGQFYFSSSIPSGNYTLLAYTKWMKNVNEERFYRTNIVLINPNSLPPENAQPVANSPSRAPEIVTWPSEGLRLDKEHYGQREKVTLNFSSASDTMNLSVSVRLLMEGNSHVSMAKAETGEAPQAHFFPDLRGELLSGILTDKASGKPISGALVSLSVPAINYTFLVSRTNEEGRYTFNVRNLSGQIHIRTLTHSMESVEIKVDDPFLSNYEHVRPQKLFLDTTLLRLLGRSYLASQVQNAFERTEPDSSISVTQKERFFATPTIIYRLDDFARFPTMEDVFREIVPEVVVKLKDGKFSLSMRNNITAERFYNSPLMLIDGIPILDANVIMSYDPLLVKDIGIMAQRYYYGGLESEGIISLETYSGKAERLDTSDLIVYKYEAPQKYKNQAAEVYEGPETDTRIPDYRTQLYWNPFLEVTSKESLVFYTGDIAGTYVVDVVGLNAKGQFVKFQTTFTVE